MQSRGRSGPHVCSKQSGHVACQQTCGAVPPTCALNRHVAHNYVYVHGVQAQQLHAACGGRRAGATVGGGVGVAPFLQSGAHSSGTVHAEEKLLLLLQLLTVERVC